MDEKGDAVFATKEFKVGEVIFEELPSVLCPYDRRVVCFHCCVPLESINESARRLSGDNKTNFYSIIPVDKKPEMIEDDITKLRFCCVSCHKKAMDSYFATFRGKWQEFKTIEAWILRNKGPPHDLATLMGLFKILCMDGQNCPNFEAVNKMIASRQRVNIDRFTKVIHEKMKINNVFQQHSNNTPKNLSRWATIMAANFQMGTVSPLRVGS